MRSGDEGPSGNVDLKPQLLRTLWPPQKDIDDNEKDGDLREGSEVLFSVELRYTLPGS